MNSISQINSSSAVALSITALLHATVIYSLLNQNFDSPIKEVEPKTVLNRTGFVGDFLFKLGHLT